MRGHSPSDSSAISRVVAGRGFRGEREENDAAVKQSWSGLFCTFGSGGHDWAIVSACMKDCGCSRFGWRLLSRFC